MFMTPCRKSPVCADAHPRVLGVLGGMGPQATADFLAKLVRATEVTSDQEHVPVFALSYPQIPDRTAAILSTGPSPLKMMLDGLNILAGAGADCIVIPCNTAHYWFDACQVAARVPMISMIDAVVAELVRHRCWGPVGLFATQGTIAADIYGAALRQVGLTLLLPDGDDQKSVNRAINCIKAGNPSQANHSLDGVVETLRAQGAARIILGCTELPLMRYAMPESYFVDSTLALARSSVRWFATSAAARMPRSDLIGSQMA